MTGEVSDKRRQTWMVDPMDGDIVGVVDKANGGECLTISEAATLLGTGRNTIFAAETSALRKLRVQ